MNGLYMCMIIEHTVSMVIEYYREYDINMNGQMNFYGIPRAKTESILETFQYFYVCFVIGLMIMTIY
jgi:hypothetical protein